MKFLKSKMKTIYQKKIYNIKKIASFLFSVIIFFSYLFNSNIENKQMKYEINYIFKKSNKININDIYIKYHPTLKNQIK